MKHSRPGMKRVNCDTPLCIRCFKAALVGETKKGCLMQIAEICLETLRMNNNSIHSIHIYFQGHRILLTSSL